MAIKVGDKVRIIDSANVYGHDFNVGEITTVDMVWNDYGDLEVCVDKHYQSVHKDDYILVTEEDGYEA